jgi:hypothetical protein
MAKREDPDDVKRPLQSGFRQGMRYPRMPVGLEDFQRLLENPDLPAQNQSAPSPSQLNPHLFGPDGRLP